jgi:type VI secretion system secreted protein Hcp
MAVDMFLKVDGLDGESVDAKYEKWIEVLSFSWGISDASKVAATPGKLSPARKTTVSDFSIVKFLDKASPKLFEKCCAGDHISELNFSLVRKAGDKQQEYYIIKLNDVLVSGVAPAGSNGSDPLEQVSFSFASSLISAVDDKGSATTVASCGAASFPALEQR